MEVNSTIIPEVKIIVPDIHYDSRGYFFESFNDKEFREKVCDTTFVQDNQSYSKYGTMRGLHWQKAPYAQSKLVRVVRGEVVDYAVDIRVGSPTFGEYVSVLLSEENNSQLFIPRGFAHGFIVLSADAIFQYKCDNLYNKESESGCNFSSITWNFSPIHGQYIDPDDIILSEKDTIRKVLQELPETELFNFDIDYYHE